LLHHKSDDTNFWSVWRELHDDSLRRVEAICFALAERWFDCRLSPAAAEEIERLPSGVARWLSVSHAAPLAGLFHPNKDEIWLHWNLLDSVGARADVLRRRLLPLSWPGPVDAVHLPEEQITPRIRLRRRWRYLMHVASRASHHLRALPPVAWSATRWFVGGTGLGRNYGLFLATAGLFDFGLFIFFLLYNLYLLQIGFKESFVGLIASAMTAGGVAGSIPAALAIQRFGLRRTLLVCFSLAAGVSALRACVISAPVLLALAFVGGAVTAVWAVAISPAVAQLTNDKNRPLGFSFVFSSGIAIGVLGGLAGGSLPGLLSRLHAASAGIAAYRLSLLSGCAIVLLALWPLSRVVLGKAPPPERKLYRPNPVVTRFLVAIAVWSFGTGAFNPFFNVFFARRHVPVDRIGFIFSTAQLTQVAAVLLAPLVFRKLGLMRGVSGMQFATALALVALGATAGPIWAGLAYAAYMAFQYMSEPGLYSFLMDAVPAGERSGASALNFLVASCAQAVAAACAGLVLDRLGYTPLLVAAAIICALAALLFRAQIMAPQPSAGSSP
jgi:predicted MFS family arabinose efflux permease